MNQRIYLELTPEELQSYISLGVKNEISELKRELQRESSEQYLTRHETAKLLSVNLSTLWSWTKKGKINSLAIGNRVYYKKSDIEKSLVQINLP